MYILVLILLTIILLPLFTVGILYHWYTRVPFSTKYFARFHNLRERKWLESGDAYERYVDNRRLVLRRRRINELNEKVRK